MIIAITGHMGVGKTTVANIFKERGFIIIDVDTLGHELLNDSTISERLRGMFGIQILGRDLKVDRKKLSKLVFNNPNSLKKLNEIVHPKLKLKIQEVVSKITDNVIIDLALYDELEADKIADKTILVETDVSNIYERLNPQYTKSEILTVMNNQNITSNFDYIVENNGTIQDLNGKVEQILGKIKL
jgi:dephospho-CoA kinase